MAVIYSSGKETLGYTDPPAMNLNKVRDSITDYYTSIIIAVIDNVVAQLTGDVRGLKVSGTAGEVENGAAVMRWAGASWSDTQVL